MDAEAQAGVSVARNEDVMNVILAHVPTASLPSCARTCQGWSAMMQVLLAVRYLDGTLAVAPTAPLATATALAVRNLRRSRHRACQQLCSLLPHFKSLQSFTLDGALFNQDHIVAVLDACQYLHSLTCLSLTSATLHTRGSVALAELLHTVTRMRQLDLRCTALGDLGMQVLQPVLVTALPDLTGLDLTDNQLTAAAVPTLISVMHAASHLRSLTLCGNQLAGPGNTVLWVYATRLLHWRPAHACDVPQLQLLQALPRLTQLHSLQLDLPTTATEGPQPTPIFSALLSVSTMAQLTSLVLSSPVVVFDRDVSALDSILASLTQLQHLQLDEVRMTSSQLSRLTDTLTALKALTYLNLGRVVSHFQVETLAQVPWNVILPAMPRLQVLVMHAPLLVLSTPIKSLSGLSELYIDVTAPEVPPDMAEALAALPSLKKLQLTRSFGGGAGATELLRGLVAAGNLSGLALRGGPRLALSESEENLVLTCGSLAALTTLRQLSLDIVRQLDMLHVARSLSALTALTCLDIRYKTRERVAVRHSVAEALAASCRCLPLLCTLVFQTPPWAPAVLHSFVSDLRHLVRLTRLHLSGAVPEGWEDGLRGKVELVSRVHSVPRDSVDGRTATVTVSRVNRQQSYKALNALAGVLGRLSGLLVLELPRTYSSVIAGLGASLSVLTAMDLSYIVVNNNVVREFGEALLGFQQLGSLLLDHGKISGGVSSEWVECLAQLTGLTSLSIMCMGWNNWDAHALSAVITNLESLQVLNAKGNSFDGSGMLALHRAMEAMTRLRMVSLVE